MNAKLAMLLLASTVVLVLASGATGTSARQQTACGPRVSLLLWPKGYKAYPLPDFEVFRGQSGPYGISNILAYGAATRDGTLGYPSSEVSTDCIEYGTLGKLSPATPLSAPVTTATRLACQFPKPAIVTINRLSRLAKRVRVVIPPRTVVADATVTQHRSSLKYATKYCAKRLPLIAPSS